jgi:SAM-dependent methyltransferase
LLPNHAGQSNHPNPGTSTGQALPKDYLWLNLRELPYFRSLLRAVEARFYRDLELPGPVLDLGCGDGHFAQIAFDHPLNVGVDPWTAPLRAAAMRRSYKTLVQAQGNQMPFPGEYFASALSNSVLEHIPAIDAVLIETSRVLKPGAPFYFCVPNHNFADSLSIGRAFNRAGMRSLGDAYRAFFNRIARHVHCDPPEVWQRRLEQAGFRMESYWHYYSPAAMQVSEWGHYLGLPSLVSHVLTHRWVLVPTRWNLAITYHLIKKHYEEDPVREDGVCTFYIARRN